MEPCKYTLEVYRDGRELDFTMIEVSGGIPVISNDIKVALSGLPDLNKPYANVVIEPVNFEDKIASKDYFVMIIETQLDCIDEEKSIFQKFEVNDPVRPDRAGEYRSFLSLVIDPTKTGEHHIFRLKNYLQAIIVSEEVKQRIENANVIGASFQSVNGDCRTIA